MFKSSMRTLSLALALVLLLTVGGVYATWSFTLGYTEPKSQDVGVSLSVFDYPPEQILPGGGDNTDDDDEEVNINNTNHYTLIDLLLNADKSYGLNQNNSFLYELLEVDTLMYSNQHVTGGNLKFVLDDKTNTSGLYYCVEMISEIECYAYTFAKADLATAGGSVVEIPAYKTILKKDTKWEAITSYLGYAKTVSLSSLGIQGGSQADIYYTIDVDTWHT